MEKKFSKAIAAEAINAAYEIAVNKNLILIDKTKIGACWVELERENGKWLVKVYTGKTVNGSSQYYSKYFTGRFSKSMLVHMTKFVSIVIETGTFYRVIDENGGKVFSPMSYEKCQQAINFLTEMGAKVKFSIVEV